MIEWFEFCGGLIAIAIVIIVPVACYHWGRFEGELIGRNYRDAEDFAQDTDSFLVAFLVEKIGVPVENTSGVLQDFRKWRERRATPERAM